MRSILENNDMTRARTDRVALFFTENLHHWQPLLARVLRVLEFRHNVHVIFPRPHPVHHLVLVVAKSELRLGEQPSDELRAKNRAVIEEYPAHDVSYVIRISHYKLHTYLICQY